MNVELLLKVKAAILAVPESYDQEVYCGTAHCIAGHAVAIANPAEVDRVSSADLTVNEESEIGQRGKLLLGLDWREGDILCGSAEMWPAPFRSHYRSAIDNPLERARIAAARIDHFIATGGAA